MEGSNCKICRRTGIKLFLKGERCFSPKCAMVRNPSLPGKKPKRRIRALSEYGKQLREKQKLREWYNLKERQFRKYVKEASSRRQKAEDAATLLIRILESRLDNVVFRLGLATSRQQARQLVSHSHFLVNGKLVNIPSHRLKKNDIINVKPKSLKKAAFQNISARLKKQKTPAWLVLDVENPGGKVVAEPSLAEAAPPAEISSIFEFYSR